MASEEQPTNEPAKVIDAITDVTTSQEKESDEPNDTVKRTTPPSSDSDADSSKGVKRPRKCITNILSDADFNSDLECNSYNESDDSDDEWIMASAKKSKKAKPNKTIIKPVKTLKSKLELKLKESLTNNEQKSKTTQKKKVLKKVKKNDTKCSESNVDCSKWENNTACSREAKSNCDIGSIKIEAENVNNITSVSIVIDDKEIMIKSDSSSLDVSNKALSNQKTEEVTLVISDDETDIKSEPVTGNVQSIKTTPNQLNNSILAAKCDQFETTNQHDNIIIKREPANGNNQLQKIRVKSPGNINIQCNAGQLSGLPITTNLLNANQLLPSNQNNTPNMFVTQNASSNSMMNPPLSVSNNSVLILNQVPNQQPLQSTYQKNGPLNNTLYNQISLQSQAESINMRHSPVQYASQQSPQAATFCNTSPSVLRNALPRSPNTQSLRSPVMSLRSPNNISRTRSFNRASPSTFSSPQNSNLSMQTTPVKRTPINTVRRLVKTPNNLIITPSPSRKLHNCFTLNSNVTITPTKTKTIVQRKLFKNEVEGVITLEYSSSGCTQYTVKLANGNSIPLSNEQVQSLRNGNNGVLPKKLKIPVSTDVADQIEPCFEIED